MPLLLSRFFSAFSASDVVRLRFGAPRALVTGGSFIDDVLTDLIRKKRDYARFE